MSIFQSRFYKIYSPKAIKLRGKYILTRCGVLLVSPRWTYQSMYRNPVVQIRFLIVSFLSLIKRGATNLDKKRNYALIHSGWTAGYYHWITESLPRAFQVRESYPDAVPLLPTSQYIGYVDSLKCIGFDDVQIFPEGKNFIGENIIFTDCPKKFGTTSPEVLKNIKKIVLEKCGADESVTPSRLVYVSRKKARGRKVNNEKEVEHELKKIGYEIFCFEDLSFSEQVRLMSETRVLVSIHGAALTNMVFMKEGSSILEIIPRKNGIFDYNIVRNSFKHDPCYFRLSDAMGHEYHYIECETDASWHSGTHMANLTVDLKVLLGILPKISY